MNKRSIQCESKKSIPLRLYTVLQKRVITFSMMGYHGSRCYSESVDCGSYWTVVCCLTGQVGSGSNAAIAVAASRAIGATLEVLDEFIHLSLT